MALTKAQAQTVSNFLHYWLMNYSLNNSEKRVNGIQAINIIDAELKALGGTVQANPLSPG